MRTFDILILSALFLGLLVLGGCRGSFDRSGEEIVSPRPTTAGDEPLGLEEDRVLIPEKYRYTRAPVDSMITDDSLLVIYPLYNRDEDAGNRYESYRIQLYTSKTYGPAVRELNIASEVFDHSTRLDYEVPYYKVRVGDFATRDEAEKYLPAVKAAGYSTAWTVKVNLNIKTLESMYDNLELPPTDSVDTADMDIMEPVNDTTLYQED